MDTQGIAIVMLRLYGRHPVVQSCNSHLNLCHEPIVKQQALNTDMVRASKFLHKLLPNT